MAKSVRGRAKDRANEAFSMYIRVRDAIETTGTTDTFICCTCNRPVPVAGNDCGHYVPGRSDTVLYVEHNAHGQCARCNRFGNGMWVDYERFIIEKYGEEENARLKQLKYLTDKIPTAVFKEIQSEYKYKLKILLEDYS